MNIFKGIVKDAIAVDLCATIRKYLRLTGFFLVFLLSIAVPPSLFAQTNGQVVSSLDPNELASALQGGGVVTFATDGIIVLTNTISIQKDVILDGAGHSITISGGGAVQIFNLFPGCNMSLRNLTLAKAVNFGASGLGGAIWSRGTLDVFNCQFQTNVSYNGLGGAVYNAGTLIVSNTTFLENSAIGQSSYGLGGVGAGGAIYNTNGTLVLNNVTCWSNAAVGGQGLQDFSCHGCNIYGTDGTGFGGAVYSSGGTFFATNLLAVGNSAVAPYPEYECNGNSAGAGGVYIASGNAFISSSTFSNNISSAFPTLTGTITFSTGGAIFNGGHSTIINCFINENNAAGYTYPDTCQGGAIFNSGSVLISVTIINGNSTGVGGAIYNSGGAQLSGCTISNNAAVNSPLSPTGGGIYNSGVISLSNTVLTANTVGTSNLGIAIFNQGAFSTDASSLVTAAYVTNFVPLSFDWLLDNASIFGASSATLNLTNVQFTTAGNYSLVLSNSSGLVTNFNEIVNQPMTNAPVIVLQPLGEETNLGATVEFDAAATGFPAPAYQWQFNNTNISGATNSTLVLTNVLQNNSGSYVVVVKNSSGMALSKPAVLTVNGTVLLTGIGLGAGGFSFSGEGLPGTNVVIEVSSDLIDWQPLRTNISPWTFIDTNASTSPTRFYRAVLVP